MTDHDLGARLAAFGKAAEAPAEPLLRRVRDRDCVRRLPGAPLEQYLADSGRMAIVPRALDQHSPHVAVAANWP